MTASKTAQMAAAISLITLSWPAANALHVVPGNNPPIDSEVVRDACGLSSDSGSGRLITGCLQDNHAELVTFASDEALQFDAGGQSSVEAQDGLYSRLSITRPGQTISKLILNLEVSRDGVVSFFDGSTFSLSYVVRSNGSNFFTVTGPLQTLSLTTFVNTFGESTAEADIIRGTSQVRLSAVTLAIPEPATYALMLAGLCIAPALMRSRRIRTVEATQGRLKTPRRDETALGSSRTLRVPSIRSALG
jgi:hypothetical protein